MCNVYRQMNGQTLGDGSGVMAIAGYFAVKKNEMIISENLTHEE